MFTKIDWISFTIKIPEWAGGHEQEALNDGLSGLYELFPDADRALLLYDNWKWENGRKFYSACYRREDNGVSIFVNPKGDHVLFEITGRGCDTIGDYDTAVKFLDSVKSRLTRLDVAADMLTETTPHEFLEEGWSKRFKSHSTRVEQSGTTVYIGSKTSNRFARIYRYNPPHERSHLLRSEWQLAKHDAEYTARAIIDNGIDFAVKALGEQFGWTHEDWQPDYKDTAILDVWRPERAKGKTMFWLNDTIAPLLLKMHGAEGFNAVDWFRENVELKLMSSDDIPF